MRTIKQYIEAAKARKENGEAGFSLVELIVVVVILGILAAVAIPIFTGIQQKAEENAVASVVGNAASQAASDIAQNKAGDIAANLVKLQDQSKGEIKGLTLTNTGTDQIDGFCISGTSTKVTTAKVSGPGCAGATGGTGGGE